MRKDRSRTDDNELEKKEEFDYEKDLSVDPDFLDAEFLNHSLVFMKYAKRSAFANKAAKLAEEKVKTLRSELVKCANEDPDQYLGKGVKPTAAVVEAFYRNNKNYKKLKEEWIEATFEADLLINAVFAFQARKTALENLVRLHGQEYFSKPEEPRDLPNAVAALNEIKKTSTRSKIKDRMSRKGN